MLITAAGLCVAAVISRLSLKRESAKSWLILFSLIIYGVKHYSVWVENN